jgi:hypothetical protein
MEANAPEGLIRRMDGRSRQHSDALVCAGNFVLALFGPRAGRLGGAERRRYDASLGEPQRLDGVKVPWVGLETRACPAVSEATAASRCPPRTRGNLDGGRPMCPGADGSSWCLRIA